MQNKALIAVIAILLAIGVFGLGWYAGSLMAPGGMAIGGDNKDADTFTAGWAAARQRLIDTGFWLPGGEGAVQAVSGTITAVAGESITVAIQPVEPLADPKYDVRTVQITPETMVYLREIKDAETLDQEFAAYWKAVEAGETDLDTVVPYRTVPADATVLTADARITAYADENIAEAESFTATRIEVEQMGL